MRVRWRRAQFMLIMVLLVALILISSMVVIYSFASHYREIRFRRASNIVSNLATDLKRMALKILATTTQHYSITADVNSSRLWAISNITSWETAVILGYSDDKVSVNVGVNRTLVINDNILGRLVVPYAPTPTDAYEKQSWIKMWWYYKRAISLIYLEMGLRVNSVEMGPLYSNALYMLNVTASKPRSAGGDLYQIRLDAYDENGDPTVLNMNNITVSYVHRVLMEWVNGTNVDLSNYGNGTYVLEVSLPDAYSLNSDAGPVVPVLIRLADSRGICAELFPSYSRITAIIEKDSNVPSNLNYEIYTVETLQDGTLIFNLHPFGGPKLPPFPPIPVKQYRVNATRTGPNSEAILTPFQVEQWNNIGTESEWPILEFPSYRGRLKHNHKIVYLLFFNNTNARQQKVVYWWSYDADAPPSTWAIKFRWDESGYAEIDNGKIRVRLVADQVLSYWVDYSIIIYFKRYHAEYALLGYSYYYMGGGSIWLPEWLPSGRPSERMGWQALVGPVRTLIIRDSTVTYSPPQGRTSTSHLHHKDMLIIPYSTTYIIYRGWIKWLRRLTINRYLTPLILISGSSSDTGCPCRLRYYKYEYGSPGYYSGSCHDIARRDVNDIGNWFVQYRGSVSGYPDVSFGAIWDGNLTNMINSYQYRYSGDHKLWIWVTCDYARRVLELDAWFAWYRSATIHKNHENWYWFAMFAGDGGGRYSGWRSIANHALMFRYVPHVYEVYVE